MRKIDKNEQEIINKIMEQGLNLTSLHVEIMDTFVDLQILREKLFKETPVEQAKRFWGTLMVILMASDINMFEKDKHCVQAEDDEHIFGEEDEYSLEYDDEDDDEFDD